MHGFVGTYTTGRSQGIYRFTFDPDTGALCDPILFAAVRDPKCVTRRGSVLASAIHLEGRSGVALWDARHPCTPPFSMCCPEQEAPCHLRFSGSSLLAANAQEGMFTVYRADSHNLSCARQIDCGKHAGCQQSLGRRGYTLVSCLGQDQVRIFDRKFSPRGVILFPKGSGPRQGIFHPRNHALWMITERSHELYHFTFADTRYQQTGCYPILPKEHPDYIASRTTAIRLSPDGKYLYVSTRGADLISVFQLDDSGAHLVQQVPCGGKGPQDLILSEDGRFVLVLCQDSDDLLCFSRAEADGLLQGIVSQITIPEGSSICL